MRRKDILRYVESLPDEDIESFYLEDKKVNKFVKLVYYDYDNAKTDKQVHK